MRSYLLAASSFVTAGLAVGLPLVSIGGFAASLPAQDTRKPPPRLLPDIDLDVKLPGGPPAQPLASLSASSTRSLSPKWPPSFDRDRLAGANAGAMFAPTLPRGQTFFDAAGPDVLWAAGDTYKASFTADGFTFIPYFGSDAPRNYPVRFSLEDLRLGEVSVPLSAAVPVRTGSRVVFARGAVREEYDVAPGRIEQKFVIAARPIGDLEVRLRVDSELTAARDAHGLRFGNGRGHVGYTDAVLVDAGGRRHAMQTELHDGRIRLRADAALLATVPFPVTVDPIVQTFTAATDPARLLLDADIAYAHTNQRYLVVWRHVFSSTDDDVWAVNVDVNGSVVANTLASIDFTSDRWTQPRVACNRIADRFLVVAERTPGGGGQREIWGRLREAASTTMLAQQQISSSSSQGDKSTPDVGGDFDTSPPTYFAVVWQRDFSSTDHDIHYRMVNGDGTFPGATQVIDDFSTNDDFRPRISKCNGAAPASAQAWIVVWQRKVAANNHAIACARLGWDGALLTSPRVLFHDGTRDYTSPSVSSLTDGGQRHWLVTFAWRLPQPKQLLASVAFADGNPPAAVDDIVYASSSETDVGYPAVDSDGCRFAVALGFQQGGDDWDPWVLTLHLNGSSLDPTEVLSLDQSLTRADKPSLVAVRSGGGGVVRYGTSWSDTSSSPTAGAVEGATYFGITSGGGYVVRPHACGGLTLTNDNTIPGLGLSPTFTVGGTTNPRFIVVSLPLPAYSLCPPSPCQLGVDPTRMILLFTSALRLTIPCSGALVGQTVAVQGGAAGISGGCPAIANLALTDTHEVTIR